MNGVFTWVLEGTLTMVLLTLLITHPQAFSKILNATSHTAVGGVQALWATKRPDVKG